MEQDERQRRRLKIGIRLTLCQSVSIRILPARVEHDGILTDVRRTEWDVAVFRTTLVGTYLYGRQAIGG